MGNILAPDYRARFSSPACVIAFVAVALTQIAVYGTHKDLAVRKIMEAMRTEQRMQNKTRLGLKKSQTKHEMRHSFLYFFSLVCISEICTQISRPLAYGVRISKAGTTAVLSQKLHCDVPQDSGHEETDAVMFARLDAIVVEHGPPGQPHLGGGVPQSCSGAAVHTGKAQRWTVKRCMNHVPCANMTGFWCHAS